MFKSSKPTNAKGIAAGDLSTEKLIFYIYNGQAYVDCHTGIRTGVFCGALSRVI
jgi:hypothetical protein